jgi:hypothetical protein
LPYTPDWEPLAQALKRVVASGVPQSRAETEICQAIADRKIGIRALIQRAAPDVGGKILLGGNVGVPPRLKPADFDWDKSRPFEPWNTGPDEGNPGERYLASWPWKPRSIEWIELSTSDVMEILCGGGPLPAAGRAVIDRESAQLASLRQRQQFVADYIARQKEAGNRPTLTGLEAEATDAGIRGGREILRATFRQIQGVEVTRGRPRKSRPKSADK